MVKEDGAFRVMSGLILYLMHGKSTCFLIRKPMSAGIKISAYMLSISLFAVHLIAYSIRHEITCFITCVFLYYKSHVFFKL